MKKKKDNDTQKDTLTVEQVAKRLGVHRNSVYKLIILGKLKPLPDFRTKIIALPEYERYLTQRT